MAIIAVVFGPHKRKNSWVLDMFDYVGVRNVQWVNYASGFMLARLSDNDPAAITLGTIYNSATSEQSYGIISAVKTLTNVNTVNGDFVNTYALPALDVFGKTDSDPNWEPDTKTYLATRYK
ncbi:hypothetical protein [Pseudomonas moraviensis]|uniref:Uncharacterized protein n=1 Tax=Pseudomonas moraviensis TaxID=321662 RepID=A0A7Y9W068_9PSED|nr:hypothetical protein [Pseudomonas moraviensis]NYH11759.1 hypothetical protein [Pseudomonas moraviensis]